MDQPTIAYFDTVAGISGDMTLGALVDAGLPLDYLRSELRNLNLTGFELEAKHVQVNGITAVKVDVVISAPDTHHRHFSDIKKLIESSTLAEEIKDTALSIFHTLAQAEAKIHNVPPEKIHFHEVGAVDSIIDIIGTAIGLAYLGVEAAYSSPVKVGAPSTVKSAHGTIPTPAPATLEILRGYPVVFTDIPGELTTPTGAALIKTLSRGLLTFESIKFDRIGYGAGTMRFEQLPNVLRIGIGTIASPEKREELLVVEANIDDMNPELYPHVIEKILSSGARDAFLTPVIMKKGRPGTMITVLCTPENRDTVINTLLAETTTIGVRYRLMYRKTLRRAEKTVETEFGPVLMKSVEIDGKQYTKPEFEECKRIAEKFDIPLIEVYRRLEKS